MGAATRDRAEGLERVTSTKCGGENEQRPLLPIVGVRDFDAGMHAACRERRLVSVTNWRNRPEASVIGLTAT